MNEIGAVEVLLQDDFDVDGRIDAGKWKPNIGEGSFLGATQMRPELPVASDGTLRLQLDTYNPSGNPRVPTYFGSEAISNQTFTLDGGGVAFEGSMRLAQPDRGLIAGFFPFWGDPERHDEIDFELIPNRGPNKIQTNLYVNDTYSGGDWKTHEMSRPLTEFHTYRIEWLPNQVRWFVDGELVRSEDQSPTRPMALHLNIWGPGTDWDTADPGLQPTGNPADNRSLFFEVDWVRVERLSTSYGDAAAESYGGTAGADLIRAAGGSDAIVGGNGDDTIAGGPDADKLVGGAGDDLLRGGAGDDVLKGRRHDDLIKGRDGDDLLEGHRHDDRLVGGEGDDVLVGGAGKDVLIGDDGADTFAFRELADSPAGPGRDRILDFNPRWDDVVDLSAVDADAGAPGDQAFRFVGREPFGEEAGELRYERVKNGLVLEGDVDGDGLADLEIFVKGPSTIFADSILL